MVSFPPSRRGMEGDHDHTLQRLRRTSSSAASRSRPSGTGTRLDTAASTTPMPFPTASNGSMVSFLLPSRRVMECDDDHTPPLPRRGKEEAMAIFPPSFWEWYPALLSLRSGRVWLWPPPIPLLEGSREGSHGLCFSPHENMEEHGRRHAHTISRRKAGRQLWSLPFSCCCCSSSSSSSSSSFSSTSPSLFQKDGGKEAMTLPFSSWQVKESLGEWRSVPLIL